MSPERLLRQYFRAKDENRPHLLEDVFASDARLEIENRDAQISFPAVTTGLEGIANVLVRDFNATYENIYSFYLDRPAREADTFACRWLVGMTEKASRNVRVGCGSYEWTFGSRPALLVARLRIRIEQMIVLGPGFTADVMRSLRELDYPWTSAAQVARAFALEELELVVRCIGPASGS